VHLNCVIALRRLKWSMQNWVWFRVLSSKCFHLAEITRTSSVLKRVRVSHSDRVRPSNLALFLPLCVYESFTLSLSLHFQLTSQSILLMS
jgi:hypothetical protein